jgi:hypothetical protein
MVHKLKEDLVSHSFGTEYFLSVSLSSLPFDFVQEPTADHHLQRYSSPASAQTQFHSRA